ncbi:MAG: hypothetical protein CMQ12_11180 [Gammaproteobacteria bacterium]|nr:hypothetical protein [Gammaproteobacteria bacterium]
MPNRLLLEQQKFILGLTIKITARKQPDLGKDYRLLAVLVSNNPLYRFIILSILASRLVRVKKPLQGLPTQLAGGIL